MAALNSLAIPMALLACTSDPTSGVPPIPGPDADTPDAFLSPRPDAAPMTPVPHERTYAPTFTAVWDEIFLPSCAWLYCHGGNGLPLVLQPKDGAYDSLMELAAGSKCQDSGLRRVEPGQPDRSLVVLKLSEPPPCGDRMPIALVASALPSEDIEQLRAWIARGALKD